MVRAGVTGLPTASTTCCTGSCCSRAASELVFVGVVDGLNLLHCRRRRAVSFCGIRLGGNLAENCDGGSPSLLLFRRRLHVSLAWLI